MKRYSLITLFSGGLLVLFLLLTRALEPFWVFLVALIPLVNFILSIFAQKLAGLFKKLIIVLVMIISISINLTFLYALTLTILNFPPEKSFNKDINIAPSDPKGELLFNELQPFFDRFNKKSNSPNNNISDYINNKKPINSDILKMIKNTENERNEIINILSEAPFYMPSLQSDSESNLPPSNIGSLIFFKLELANIKQLLEANKHDAAISKYVILWKCSNNLLLSKNQSLINSLIAKASLEALIDFYNNNHKFIKKQDMKRLNLNEKDICKNIEACMGQGYLTEYISYSKHLKSIKFKWPLFDYNKTILSIYDNFQYLANSAKLSSNPQIEDSSLKYATTWSQRDLLINPIGTYYAKQSLSLYNGLNNSVYILKDKVRKMAAEI
jgi:hypothetical protein